MEDFLFLSLKIVSFLIFIGSLRLLGWIWWTPMKLERKLREQGIRGPRYRLWYGNLTELSRLSMEACSKPMALSHEIMPRVLPLLCRTVKDYGKMSVIWIGPVPRVIITDPELVREVLSNKFGHFEKQKQTPLTKLMATGLANYDGEKWAIHRRLLTPAFHVEKLKRMLPAFLASCTELVERWEKLVGSQESHELDVWPELQSLTADVISRTAFGSSYKEGKRIFQILKEQAVLISKALQTVYIPGYRFLPTEDNDRRKKLRDELEAILESMIEKRESAMKMGDACTDDLLGLLLESNNNDRDASQRQGKDNKNIGMTTKDVIEECKLFYFAGHETTSNLLTWTMVVLAMHPSWQVRARAEVLEVFGKDTPDFDGLNQLKIVAMILHEVLRLYPPGVQLVRRTYKSMKLGDFTIPPDVQISLPVLLIHHDREYWGDDAEEFKPERFSGGISKASKHQLAYFPFGWGPRICIGQNFALMEAKMALALILQHFSFELSPSYAHAPKTVITLQPEHGAQLILQKVRVNHH